MLPGAKYVGWDIIPTNKGMELLEGNVPLGEVLPQMFETAGIKNYLLEVLNRNNARIGANCIVTKRYP